MTIGVPAPATTYQTESRSGLRLPTLEEDDAGDGGRMFVVHQFVWPEKPPTMNAWNLMHHQVRAAHRAQWREAFRLMGQGCAPLAWCHITVDHIKGTRRNIDVGAPFPAVKAAIDGCVLAGILPDDTPAHVRSLRFNAPVYDKGYDALILTLDGYPAA